MAMKLKVIWNNDIRILKTDSNNWHEIVPTIRGFVRDNFKLEDCNITYLDEEDEKITISCTSDFADAVSRWKSLAKVPKLFITLPPKYPDLPSPQGDNRLSIISHYSQSSSKKQPSPSTTWTVEPSTSSLETVNKIREVVDQIDMSAIPKDLPFISIAIGDPTKYPNLLPSPNVTKSVQNNLLSSQSNGYTTSYGAKAARVAIAKKYSLPHIKLSEEDVVLGSGCSDALNMAICALLNKGDNMLIPRPGFSFYETLASRYGFGVKFYDLMPESEWQIDTRHLSSQIDDRTKCILVNNPSNPCGSVLSKENLLEVLQIAEKFSLPIVSDEIYGGMVYDDNCDGFIAMAELTKKVPVLSLGGLSKQYLVPGWRVGWCILHDPTGAMVKVRTALQKLSALLLGANTVIQASIPSILFETADSYYEELNDKLGRQSKLMFEEFDRIDGLKPVVARGAMYVMVKIEMDKFEGIKDDIDFANRLLKEQGVLCLPGTIFNMKNYFRAVICPPPKVIREIGQRMGKFCGKYHKGQNQMLVSKM